MVLVRVGLWVFDTTLKGQIKIMNIFSILMRLGVPREINTCTVYITINNGGPASGIETDDAFEVIWFPIMVTIRVVESQRYLDVHF